MIEDFRGSLYPWIIVEPENDNKAIIQSFSHVRNALDDLIAMKISWHEYLDILDHEGVDMDDYLTTAESNIISVGF